jgi:hypothetical protein
MQEDVKSVETIYAIIFREYPWFNQEHKLEETIYPRIRITAWNARTLLSLKLSKTL